MTNADVSTAVVGIQAAGDLILQEVSTIDPGLALPAGVAEMLLDLSAKAVKTWMEAAGIEPTAANFQLLVAKLNPAPLSPSTI